MDSPSGQSTSDLISELSIQNPGEDSFSSIFLLAFFVNINN